MPSQIDTVIPSKKPSPTAQKIAVLEAALTEEKSRLVEERRERKQERVVWLIAVIGLLLVFFFKYLDNTLGIFFVGILSLVLIMAAAGWLEMPWIIQYIIATIRALRKGDKGSVEEEPPE